MSFSVNGTSVAPPIVQGYAVTTRDWQAGDRIDLELPTPVQRLKADPRVEADRGRVALRYGPLIYSVERADQPDLDLVLGPAPLTAVWRPDLLQGVMAIQGRWADASPMLAIPYFARLNRLAQTGRAAAAPTTDPAAGTSAPSAAASARTNTLAAGPATSDGSRAPGRRSPRDGPHSMVWIKDQ
jgi:hypothetical protein